MSRGTPMGWHGYFLFILRNFLYSFKYLIMSKKQKQQPADDKKKVWGDPEYSPKDDIYSREKKEELEEEDDTKLSHGLDVPGAEEDDLDEEIGEEDEENNYYSIGGDEHNNLEEEKED
jgi:hypothetical protein